MQELMIWSKKEQWACLATGPSPIADFWFP